MILWKLEATSTSCQSFSFLELSRNFLTRVKVLRGERKDNRFQYICWTKTTQFALVLILAASCVTVEARALRDIHKRDAINFVNSGRNCTLLVSQTRQIIGICHDWPRPAPVCLTDDYADPFNDDCANYAKEGVNFKHNNTLPCIILVTRAVTTEGRCGITSNGMTVCVSLDEGCVEGRFPGDEECDSG